MVLRIFLTKSSAILLLLGCPSILAAQVQDPVEPAPIEVVAEEVPEAPPAELPPRPIEPAHSEVVAEEVPETGLAEVPTDEPVLLEVALETVPQNPPPTVEEMQTHLMVLAEGTTKESRLEALRRLAESRDARILPVLLAQTRQGTLASRTEVVEALGRFADPGVALYLAGLAGSTRNPTALRETAITALGDQGIELAGELLLELGRALPGPLAVKAEALAAAKYPREVFLRAAVEAGNTGVLAEQPQDAELVRLLVQLSATSMPASRAASATGLGRLQDPRAVRALDGAIRSRDRGLAQAAVDALGNLDVPLSAHILARGVSDSSLPMARRGRCLKMLMEQANIAAAPLVFELSWSHSQVFTKVASAEELASYLNERLNARMVDRSDQSRAAFDVELLIDLQQMDSSKRTLKALNVARKFPGRIHLLPALLRHLQQPGFQREAVLTVGQYDSDRARISLGRIVADVTESGTLRLLALEHLARQQSPQAFKLLVQLHKGERNEESRVRILESIRQYHPEAGRQAGLIVDEKIRSGLIPMMIVGGIHAGAMMGLASDSIDPRDRSNIVLPVVGGAILGAGGPLLLTLGDEVHPAEAAWVGTIGGWGLLDGALVAAMFQRNRDSEEGDEDDSRLLEATMAAGQLTGLVTAWLTRKDAGRDPGMIAYLNLSAVVGLGAGWGIALLDENSSSNLGAGLALSGSIGASLASRYLARDVKFSTEDHLLMASTSWMSAWSVAWMARSMGITHKEGLWGGIMLGTGLGFAGGSVLAAYTDWDVRHSFYSNSAFAAGNLAGFGAAKLVEDSSTEMMGALMVTGGAAALTAAVILADDLRFEGADVWTVTSATGIGGWSGGWLAESFGADHAEGPLGGVALGSALGYGIGSVLAATTDVDPAFLGYVNLAYFMGNTGGLGAALQSEHLDAGSAGAWMVGSGAAALGSAVFLGRDLRFSNRHMYQTALTMGLGGWTGYYALNVARPDHISSAEGGLLLGTAAGFAAGSVLAAFTDPEFGHLNRGAAGFGIGTSFGLGMGLVMTDLEERWANSMMLAGGLAGTASYLAMEDYTSYSDSDVGLLALGGLWGTWQGNAMWQALGGTSDSTRTGARLLGGATGLIATTAVSQFADWEWERIAWASSGGAVGSILGGGLGLMASDLPAEGRWTLSVIGGWSGLLSELLLVPDSEFTGGDVAAMVAGTGWGIGQSWLIANAVDASETALIGALMFGGSVGYLSGEVYGRATDANASAVLYTELASYGSVAMGSGSVLLGGGSDETLAVVTSLSGWGAKIATAFVAEDMQFAPDDAWEYLLGQGFGAWQGLGYAAYFDVSDRRRGGATLMGISSGFLVPLVLNQFGDFTAWEDFLLTGGIVWGTWFGVWSPYAYGDTGFSMKDDPKLLGALIGGEVGLLATGLSLALGVSPETVGWTQLVGLMGMALGSSGTAIFSQDGPTVGTGMLVGTAAGLVTGAIWGEMRHQRSDSSAGVEKSEMVAHSSTGRRYSGKMPEWLRSLRPASLIAPPPAGHDDQPVLLFGVEGVL
jgi:HEAT repeat protein